MRQGQGWHLDRSIDELQIATVPIAGHLLPDTSKNHSRTNLPFCSCGDWGHYRLWTACGGGRVVCHATRSMCVVQRSADMGTVPTWRSLIRNGYDKTVGHCSRYKSVVRHWLQKGADWYESEYSFGFGITCLWSMDCHISCFAVSPTIIVCLASNKWIQKGMNGCGY